MEYRGVEDVLVADAGPFVVWLIGERVLPVVVGFAVVAGAVVCLVGAVAVCAVVVSGAEGFAAPQAAAKTASSSASMQRHVRFTSVSSFANRLMLYCSASAVVCQIKKAGRQPANSCYFR